MVHKTRKKPYHHVTYYHQWQSNRGVLEEKTEREQRFPDSPKISRRKKEFHVNQNEPSRLPSFGCSCGISCAELTVNDRWAWWTDIGWNTSHEVWPAQTLTQPGNWQAIAESVYASLSAKTQLLHPYENMWKHARIMLMNVSTRPSKHWSNERTNESPRIS